jgi:hypothetical protein
MTIKARFIRFLHAIFGSADYERLQSAISETWIDLDRQVQEAGPATLTEPWARAASRLLLDAESHLANCELQQGWVALSSAQRAMLSNTHDPDLVFRTAIALRQEVAKKVSDWRARAIADLICEKDGQLLAELREPREVSAATRMRVSDAVAIRDDQYNTTYFKIALRRRHLRQLFAVLLIGIALVLVLSTMDTPPRPLGDWKLVAGIILLGAFGASFSVAQNLMTTDIASKIPDQQIGAFVIWMRPAVGAAAALVSLVLFHALHIHNVRVFEISDEAVALAVAFLAGFSERFIMGPIGNLERVASPKTDK